MHDNTTDAAISAEVIELTMRKLIPLRTLAKISRVQLRCYDGDRWRLHIVINSPPTPKITVHDMRMAIQAHWPWLMAGATMGQYSVEYER